LDWVPVSSTLPSTLDVGALQARVAMSCSVFSLPLVVVIALSIHKVSQNRKMKAQDPECCR